MADSIYWIWLAECLGPGCRDLEPLLRQFGSAYDIFSAGESAYYRIPGVSEATTEKLCRARDLGHAEEILDRCARAHIGVLTYDDPAYPARLRALLDPPAVLYYRGHLPDLDRRVCVSVVGTRSMSEYGGRSAYKISYELASANVVVISGMALGIDSVAQCAALAAGGETVAVLGGGVDIIYPAEHRLLYDRVCSHGAVVSEYPPGTPPKGQHFPVRNRIISALSLGTLVVEADLRSGALITARAALAQGRDLFAIPGEIGSFHAAGANELLHAGANMVLTAKDILDNYRFLYRDVLNLPAYAASVEHSDFNPQMLDEMGVAARVTDFKLRTGQGRRPAKALEPKADPAPVQESSAPPPRRNARLPGEPPPKKAAAPKPPVHAPTHASAEGIDLSPACRSVLALIPEDRAVSTDKLIGAGVSPADLTVALTQLELSGLIEGLPGNLYIRTDS
ncbi:MAG: DNA-processing protein DprA [Clostridia bacterium]|nr:DNA-processing protein DprA [Clostridia bacterium]